MKTEKQTRTTQQNRALHAYFGLVANELNASGQSIQEVLKHSVEINWTPDNVKEVMWRSIQEALLKKKSTTNLETGEVDKVYDHMNRFLGEKCEVHVPFPSREHVDNFLENNS